MNKGDMGFYRSFDNARAFADIFGVLSSPHRLQILSLLAVHEKISVGDILAHLTDLKPSTLSNHLVRLRQAGLISCRREHRFRFYFISDERAMEVLKLAERL